MGVRLAGMLAVVPSGVRGIEDLQQSMSEAEANRIVQVTGVRERRVAAEGQTTADLGAAAARSLLARLGLGPDQLDGIIFVTQTPDYPLPATACILQHELGLSKQAFAFDVNQGCAAYPYGLAIARALIVSGMAGRILLLVGDVLTKIVDPSSRASYPLFGDAATATLLKADPDGEDVLSLTLGTDGAGWHHLVVPVGQIRYRNVGEFDRRASDALSSICPPDRVHMNGNEIFAFTLREIPGMIERTLSAADMSPGDVDYYFLHQANRFILDHLCSKIGIPPEKAPQSIDRFGNTSGGSPVVTACDCLPGKETRRELAAMFVGFGVGLSWGAALVRLRPESVWPIEEI